MATTTATSSTRSTKTWKAAGAVGVGVALLAAGGASFAEWRDQENVVGPTAITAGTLDLEAPSTGGGWTNAAGTDMTTKVTDGSYLIVPGDSLTYREQLTVDVEGDVLTGTVAHNLGELTGDDELRDQLRTNATMTLDGEAVTGTSTTVSASDEKQLLDVAVVVDFPDTTTDLVGQGQTVNLGGLDITLEQNPVEG